MKKMVIPAILLMLDLISLLVIHNLAFPLFNKQLGFITLGLVLFYAIAKMKATLFFHFSFWIYLILNLLLILTLLIGHGRGTHRWLSLAGFTLQSSQLAIPFIGLFLARLSHNFSPINLKSLIFMLVMIVVPASLIFLEPDLGTSLLFLLPSLLLIFVSGVKSHHLLSLSFLAIVLAVVGFQLFLRPYQKNRILNFVKAKSNSTEQLSPSAYNRNQALIAIGSAGLWGKGLGKGTQAQLKFLPEKQTDFIFASLTEEGGLILATMVIALYVFLIALLLKQVNLLASPANLFVFYLTSLLAWQIIINLGGNLGLMPITGLTLPFISYGGSSIISLSLALGIVQAFIGETKSQPKSII